MNADVLIKKSNSYFVNTYSRFPAVIVTGEGCRIWDVEGNEYLDFLSGIAVCSLGHNFKPITEAICRQAAQLTHISNLFHTIPQIELAEALVVNSFADKVFFANSGAEANEAAIKLARIYSAPGKHEIISLQGSFHGRTLATVAATGQKKFHQGFDPIPEGFAHAPFGDFEALEQMVNEKTCAILCEPLQGEGGVRPLSKEYLAAIRKLCDNKGLLLIFDEIQVGMGRTGTLFAYEQLGVVPDILTSAKALANGLPLGAMLTTDTIAAAFTPGTHASTFGGNPVACAAALVTMKTLLDKGFLDEVGNKGAYLAGELGKLAEKHPHLATGARGMGLIQGLILTDQGITLGQNIVTRMFEKRVLCNFAGNAVIRCVPPLIVTQGEIDQYISALDETLSEID